VAESVRSFVEDVREGMAEREAENQAAFTDGTLLADEVDPEEEGFRYR
jgi:hypothetical protein